MQDFDFPVNAAPVRRNTQTNGRAWLAHASATFAGALLAGAILLVGIRVYIHWSISDNLIRNDKATLKGKS